MNSKLFVFGYSVISFMQVITLGFAALTLRNEEIIPKLSLTFSTFMGSCLGALLILVFCLLELALFFDYHSLTVLVNGVRSFGSVDNVQNVLTILAFLTSVCSALVVSLVWFEFASQMQKTSMTSGAHVALSRYKVGVFFYVLIFMLTSFVFVALNEISYATIVGIPGCFFIFATYLYGYWRLSRIIKHFAVAEDSNAERSATKERLNFILASILHNHPRQNGVCPRLPP